MPNPGNPSEPNQTQQKMKGAGVPGQTTPGQNDGNDEEFTYTSPHEREDERSATNRKNDVNQSGKTSGGDQNRNRDNQNNRNNQSDKNNTQRQ